MEIFHLVYRSHAVPDLSNQSVQEILATAREHNAKHAITGLLIYRQNSFLQLLEGSESDVNTLMQNIFKDPRHQSVSVLVTTKSELRLFEKWSMAFVDAQKDSHETQSLFELFDTVIQNNTKDKNVILPLLNRFMGIRSDG